MDFTFEQLPQAVKLLFEKLSSIEQLLLDNNRSFPTEQHDVYISIKEAAKVANLSVTTLYGHVSRRTIPHMKKGKRLYFSKLELNQWIKEGRIKTINEVSSEAREIINARKGVSNG